mmetsp:Transcript_2565/g.5837  ORF Transcript_2565/g.5837 Transcript_2565/m.5837 type:complete len:135 (+) Transcript_2565:1858-2262(+)
MSRSPIKLSAKVSGKPISKESLMSPYSLYVLTQLRKCKVPKLEELSSLRSKSVEPARKKVNAHQTRVIHWVNGNMSLRDSVNTYSAKEMLKESMRKVRKLPRRKIGRWTDHISYQMLQNFEPKPQMVTLPSLLY